MLGGALALELGAANRRLALVRRGAALLDQPLGAALGLGRLGVLAIGAAKPRVRAFALVQRLLHLALALERQRLRSLLLLGGPLGRDDQRGAAIALLERALTPAAGRLSQLSQRAVPDAAGACHGGPAEGRGKRAEVLDDPGVREQSRGQGEHRWIAVQQLHESARTGRRRGTRRRRRRCGVGHERTGALVTGALEHRLGLRPVADHRGAEPPAERRGERQLIAGRDRQRALERVGGAAGGRVAAQELVHGRELRAHAGGFAPCPLHLAFGLAQRVTCRGHRRLGGGAPQPVLLARQGPLRQQSRRLFALRRQLLQLADELLFAALLE